MMQQEPRYTTDRRDGARERLEDQSIGFGLFDRLGREIGVVARVDAIEVREVQPDERTSWFAAASGVDRAGIWFEVNVQATRNGKRYGASQPDAYFATREAAAAFIAKRIEASRKAAQKKGTPR
jgi:hypothetical protein